MPHTLLLADDSVTIQRVIELTFADQDIRVVAVSDGDQAIASVNEQPPDIVLADIGMPGRSGYDVAQHIRSTPRLAHIPVLLLQGAFEPVDQARAQQAGCDGVLAKPFEPQLVIGRVRELLGRGRDQAPHEAASFDARLAAPVHQANGSGNPFDGPASAVKAQTPDEVSSYFDKLDEAFASMSGSQAPGPAAASTSVDWFGGAKQRDAEPAAVPLSYGSPQSGFEAAPIPLEPPAPTPAAPIAPAAAVSVAPSTAAAASAATVIAPAAAAAPEAAKAIAPQPASAPVAARGVAPRFPALQDAFGALLAAEQSGPSAADAPAWPVPPAAPAPEAPPIDVDAIVEQVTRRVLEQMSDRVVRETVATLVTQTAERLIISEIERIKARIK